MFHLAFYSELETGRSLKHNDFRSNVKMEVLKNIISDFPQKEDMFRRWKEMEMKRNDLCYGYPNKIDIKEYISKYFEIKKILEDIIGKKFTIDYLTIWLEEFKDE